MTTTVTNGNSVVIPKEVAADLGIKPGSRLEWERPAGSSGTVVVKVVPDRAAIIASLYGAGKRYLKPGDDPIGDLVRERSEEDAVREASL